MKLDETQQWFAGAVMRDAGLDEVDGRLTRGPKLDARGRLDVYRGGYVARLVECLADDYPVLKHALGEGAFDGACRRYLARFPSEAPNLNAYGRRMAETLDGFAADLARLEWAMVEVIHEPALPPVTMEALAAIPPESWGGVRLTAAKALRLLSFAYPVNDYFQAVRDEKYPEVPGPHPSSTAVYRSGPTVWRLGLTPPMQRVLAALLAGEPLEAALDCASDAPPEHVTAWFREWMTSGLFVDVTSP
ncbi:MAG TPA: DNA-binding domain-containing protein [Polyangiaceae bacterium]